MKKYLWLVVSLALVVVIILFLLFSQKNTSPETNLTESEITTNRLTVQVQYPKQVDYNQSIVALGELVPWEVSSISSDLNGLRVISVSAEAGQTVKKGQTLAKLEDAFIRAEVVLLQAQSNQAQIALTQAQDNANRARNLGDTGALSQMETTQLLAAEQTASAQLQATKAQLAAQQLRLKYTNITAPDSGMILTKTAKLGQVVAAGQELFSMMRQSKLEWVANVGSSELAQIQVGTAVTVKTENGIKLAGKVRLVSPLLDANSRNAKVFVSLDNVDLQQVTAGSFAQGKFLIKPTSGLVIPQSAIVMRQGKAMVFVVNDNNMVLQRQVKSIANLAQKTVVQGELVATDHIIVRGAEFLNPGNTVNPVSID